MKNWVIKKEDQIEIIGYSEHPTHLASDGWEIVCESPTLDKDIIDLVDVIDEVTKQVVGKRAVVVEAKRQAKIAKEKADVDKAKADHVKLQNDLKLREDMLEAMWEFIANGNMAKVNALKAKK